MKLKYIILMISVLLLLTACGNEYEKRMDNLQKDINNLGETNGFTFPKSTTTPVTTGETKETPASASQNPTEFSTLEDIQFTGNSSVTTYSDSMKILYEEFKRERANYETSLIQLKEGKISTALAIENLNQVLNSTIVKKEVLETKEIPSDYKLSFSKFNELFKTSIVLQIDILTKNLSNIEEPTNKKTKEINQLNEQLKANEYTLFDEYQLIYTK